ncbi:hypothetical protein KR222_001457, partial [Zaprionus bogoriensis]
VMTRIFELTYPASLLVHVKSWECCVYLYRIMKFVGYLPPEQGVKRYVYLLWAGTVLALSGIYLPIGYALNLTIGFRNFTPGEFLTLCETFLNTVGASLKCIIGLVCLTRMHQMKPLLDQLDEMIKCDSDRRKIHKAVALCNYVFATYGKLYFSYWMSGIFAGILSGQPPWLIYNPFFDWHEGSIEFWMQSLIEYFIGYMALTMVLVWDTWYLLFLIICRAHISILKDHISSLRTDPLKTEFENHEDLVQCIVYHRRILRCCNLVRPVVSRTIFVQFLLIGLVLGLTLVNIQLFSGVIRGLPAIVLSVAALFQSFPFCYLCDFLVEDCGQLSNLLAQSQWQDAPPYYKSTVKIFLHHLQQPIIFSAGGIFLISMDNNIKMAKFAFSVMTILQKMDLADRFK